jgi:hypothetical protein
MMTLAVVASRDSFALRNQLICAQLRKQAGERIFGHLVGREAKLAAARQVGLNQSVLLCHLAPECLIAGHLSFQRANRAVETSRFDAKPVGQAAPKPLPAKHITVHGIEGGVVPMFIAWPTALPTTVCGLWTFQLKLSPAAAAKTSSFCSS